MPVPKKNLILTIDAFNTLIKPRKPLQQQYIEEAVKYGLNPPKNSLDLLGSFKKAFNRTKLKYPHFGGGEDPKRVGYRVWWHHVISQTFRTFNPETRIPPELCDAIIDRFSGSEGYELYPDVLPFLTTLFDQSNPPVWRYGAGASVVTNPRNAINSPCVMLGVLSNCDSRIPRILESLGIAKYFSFYTLSYDHGLSKPARQLFREARLAGLRTLNPDIVVRDPATNVEIKEVWDGWDFVHIGDDLFHDYLAAGKVADFTPIWLDRSGLGLRGGEVPKFEEDAKPISSTLPAKNTSGWRKRRLEARRNSEQYKSQKHTPPSELLKMFTINKFSDLFKVLDEVPEEELELTEDNAKEMEPPPPLKPWQMSRAERARKMMFPLDGPRIRRHFAKDKPDYSSFSESIEPAVALPAGNADQDRWGWNLEEEDDNMRAERDQSGKISGKMLDRHDKKRDDEDFTEKILRAKARLQQYGVNEAPGLQGSQQRWGMREQRETDYAPRLQEPQQSKETRAQRDQYKVNEAREWEESREQRAMRDQREHYKSKAALRWDEPQQPTEVRTRRDQYSRVNDVPRWQEPQQQRELRDQRSQYRANEAPRRQESQQQRRVRGQREQYRASDAPRREDRQREGRDKREQYSANEAPAWQELQQPRVKGRPPPRPWDKRGRQ